MATERWSVAGFGDDLLNSSNITYSNMSMGNNSNDSNITTPAESVYRSYSGKEIIFFLCCTIGVGALVRHLLNHTHFPYTVVLIVLGLLLGFLDSVMPLKLLGNYTAISRIDPHLLLLIFLPALLFESAFVMDIHTFRKMFWQVLALAAPGLLITSALTAVMAKYLFTYNWSWVAALLFGAILSATDPVAVAALLKEQVPEKQLGTLIEGESLLNDGTAIILFNLMLSELMPGGAKPALQVFLYLLRVILGGPLFGYIMGRITVWWLAHVFNDAVVEITITLASTYFTYYVGDVFFGVSGVLAVVIFGIVINARRTNISPAVDAFLYKFWNMLSYLVNTLIFVLVGLVIAHRAFSRVDSMDWVYLVVLYFGSLIIRLLMVALMSPILVNIGYKINWRCMLLVVWCGLRGAVGLALALVVEQRDSIYNTNIGSKILFHTAGIVLLTLLINGTTLRYLLKMLGMMDISHARNLSLVAAVRRIEESKVKATKILKSDKFLADSHWEVVAERTVLHFPVQDEVNEDVQVTGGTGFLPYPTTGSNCPACNEHVPRVLLPNEKVEYQNDFRQRVVRAEQTSYWRQYRQGMLDEDAVLVLNNIADDVLDNCGRMLEIEDVEKYWKSPKYLLFLQRWLTKALRFKYCVPNPRPQAHVCELAYRVVSSSSLDWFIFFVLLLDFALSLTYVLVSDGTSVLVLHYCNYIIVAIYMAEAILKLIGYRRHYLTSLWHLFDLFVLLVSWVEIYLSLSYTGPRVHVSSLRFLRMLRFLHSLKLIKLIAFLLLHIVNDALDRSLRLGYGIGKGFVLGKEEVLKQFFDSYEGPAEIENIITDIKSELEVSRINVLRSLYQMQRENPKVAQSLKTRQAIRVILNHCMSAVEDMKSNGMLEEGDANTLTLAIEEKVKHLRRAFHQLVTPPRAMTILVSHPLLMGLDEEILADVLSAGQIQNLQPGDVLLKPSDWDVSLFIVIEGLVKVISQTVREDTDEELVIARRRNGSSPPMPSVPKLFSINTSCSDHTSIAPSLSPIVPPPPDNTPLTPAESKQSVISKKHTTMESTSFYGVGSLLGEVALLEDESTNLHACCETGVKVFHIQRLEAERLLFRHAELEERLWKLRGVSVAAVLMERLVEYKDKSRSDLLLILYETAFMVDLKRGRSVVLEVPKDWKHVILISGQVTCVDTNEIFFAPCIIPRNVNMLKISRRTPKILIVSSTKFHKESSTPQQREGQEDSTLTGIKSLATFPLRQSISTSRNWIAYFKDVFRYFLKKLRNFGKVLQVEFHDTLEDPKPAVIDEESRLKPFPLSWKRKKMSPKLIDFSMPLEPVLAHTISTDSLLSLRKCQSDNTLCKRRCLKHERRHASEFVVRKAIARLSKDELTHQTCSPKVDFGEFSTQSDCKGQCNTSASSERGISKKTEESRVYKKSVVEPIIPPKSIEEHGVTKKSKEELKHSNEDPTEIEEHKNDGKKAGNLESLKILARKSNRIVPQAWVTKIKSTEVQSAASVRPPVHHRTRSAEFRRRASSAPNIQTCDRLRVRFMEFPLSDVSQDTEETLV